ncbi:hypothetical protein M9Y10_013617 [Tritrichomonas musculus]|uniref:HOOK N-terminal domain-containing protein n=1 Tax=Tritrichomonas musculus TaxID=1915356 RepID=A0ABR2KXA1_9EUKA
MSDLNSALLAFLKLSNEIDPRIGSFREIDQPSIFHNIFFSLFKVNFPADDEQFKTRMMLRWLFEHVPKQLSEELLIKSVQVDDFERCDVDALEQTALLIFACKTKDNDEFQSMMEKLDPSDRKVLQTLIDSSKLTSSPQKIVDRQLLSHMAKDVRELSNCFIQLKKAEEDYSIVSKEYEVMRALEKVKINEEEQEMRKLSDDIKSKLISSQESLNNLETELTLQRNASNECDIIDTQSSIDDSEETIFNLTQNNIKLQERIESARQNTTGIAKLREEVLQQREIIANLRIKYQEIKNSVEEVETRVSDIRQKSLQKNSELNDEIQKLKDKKESLNKMLEENIKSLKEAKISGASYEKCILLRKIREQRNQILKALAEVAKKANQLQDCHST